MSNAEAAENPFFLMAPEMLRGPVVALATLATIIASQAVITGAFSVARAALQLGMLPRLEIKPHIRGSSGPDLHPGDQLGPDVWRRAADPELWLFDQTGGRLRHFGLGLDGRDLVPVDLLSSPCSQMAAPSRDHGHGAADDGGIVFVSANLLKFFDGGYVPVMISAVAMIAMI